MKRRSVLKATLNSAFILPLGLSLKLAKAEDFHPGISVLEVQDKHAEPLLQQGDLVLVDTTIQHFKGEGMYLYPDWGQPKAYFITQKGSQLQFFYPGKQQLLWQQTNQSFDRPALFAGKVLGITNEEQLARADFSWVPLKISS